MAEGPGAGTETVEPVAPPESLKPWYYQYWFLYPAFMFWPVWSLLILRSPWHNGLVSGAVAWAALFVGSYLVYAWGIGGRDGLAALLAGDLTPGNLLTGQIVLPGLVLSIVTQSHWLRNRRRIMAAARDAAGDGAAAVAATTGTNAITAGKAAGGRAGRRRGPRRRKGRGR